MVKLLPSLMLAVIAGVDSLGNGLAIASLLFAGTLGPGLGAGLNAVLLGAVVIALVVALRSPKPNAVAVVQETTVAIVATALASMAAHLAGAPDEVRVATALAILGTSSLTTGLLFWAFGRLRLGSLVRFLPYPVMAGFLAGSGWLLVEGGLMLATGAHGLREVPAALAHWDVLAVLVPAVLFAAAMVFVLQRVSGLFAGTALILGAGVLFHIVLAIAGIDAAQARAWNFLPVLPQEGSLPVMWPSAVVQLADWREVLATAPVLLSVSLVSIFGLLLNASGVEMAGGKDFSADAELRADGGANVLSGLLGGPSGFLSLSMTVLADRLGADGRAAGVLTAALLAVGVFFGKGIVSVMPTFLTAGLILFLGAELLADWVVKLRRRLPAAEWLVVVAVLVAIAALGLVGGLAAGLAFSIILFVYDYSRQPVIGLKGSGVEFRSSVDRSVPASRFLNANGAAIFVLHLRGYLFFGTADKVVAEVRARLRRHGDGAPLRFVVFDFRHVSGVDSAAISCFAKIRNLLGAEGVVALFSHCNAEVRAALRADGLEEADDGSLSTTSDFDHAMEKSEELLLADAGSFGGSSELPDLLRAILGDHPRLADAVAVLEVQQLPAGATLIRAGDLAGGVYFIARGRVRVQVSLEGGRAVRLRTMTAGAIVGEIATYLRQQRTADVIVEEPAVVHLLTQETLDRLECEDSGLALLFHRLLATSLSEKLVGANRLVELLQR